MIGTFFVAMTALVVAILGCAWAKPVGIKDSSRRAPGLRWTRRRTTSDRNVNPQEQ
jgi:hypothetical protein